jgi:hypothetical protein
VFLQLIAILKRVEDLPAGSDRYEALNFIIETMPDTSAAKRANRLLAETPSTGKPLIQVKREDLQSYESLLAQAGLNLKKEWWDGNKDNGEIGEEGIFWDAEGTVWFRVEGALGPDSSYMTPKIVEYDIEKDEDELFQ